MFFYSEFPPPPPVQIVNYITMSLATLADASNTGSYPGTGTVWYNLLDTRQTLNLVNGTALTTSNGIKAMKLDGGNDYIDAPYLPPSVINQSDNTITFWIKRDGDNTGVLISNLYGRYVYPGAFYRGHGYNVLFSGGSSSPIQCYLQDGNGRFYRFVTTGVVPNDGKFYNITIRNRTEVFINGVNANSVMVQAAGTVDMNWLSNQAFRIGSNLPDVNNWYLAANIAAFQLYDRALNNQEIIANFNGSKASFGF